MNRRGAGWKRHGVANTEVFRECFLETLMVGVGVLIPAVCRGIGHIINLFLGNPRSRDWNPLHINLLYNEDSRPAPRLTATCSLFPYRARIDRYSSETPTPRSSGCFLYSRDDR